MSTDPLDSDSTQTCKVTVPAKTSLSQTDRIVDELRIFDLPHREIPVSKLAVLYFKLLFETLNISTTYLAGPVLQLIGLALMNKIGEVRVQAAFGTAITFINLFFYAMIIPLVDRMGIELARGMGSKNYKQVKKIFSQGIVTALLLTTLFTMPLMLMSRQILTSVGINHEIASTAGGLLQLIVLSCYIEAIYFVIQTFCFSQGAEDVFSFGTIVAFIIGTLTSYLLVVHLNFKMYGWLLGRLVFDGIILGVSLSKLFKVSDPKTLGHVNKRDFMDGYVDFLTETVKFAFSSYSEFIGYEISSYYVYRNTDQNQVAAYVVIFNFLILIYSFSESSTVVFRTRMNVLVGMNKSNTAKTFFKYYITGLVILGAFVSLLMFTTRHFVAGMLASSNQSLRRDFLELFSAYSFTSIFDNISLTVFMVVKSLGRVDLLVWLNIIIFCVLNFALNYWISVTQKMRVLYNQLTLSFMIFLLILICLTYSLVVDWSQVTFDLDDDLNLMHDDKNLKLIDDEELL